MYKIASNMMGTPSLPCFLLGSIRRTIQYILTTTIRAEGDHVFRHPVSSSRPRVATGGNLVIRHRQPPTPPSSSRHRHGARSLPVAAGLARPLAWWIGAGRILLGWVWCARWAPRHAGCSMCGSVSGAPGVVSGGAPRASGGGR
jgi:hypothetical protein